MMKGSLEFYEKSYQAHADHYKKYLRGGKDEIHSKTWTETDTVDSWRHKRMYSSIDSILKTEPNAKWLTVGDGRYGTDANYILTSGGDALASDLSDSLLKEAKATGFITKFSKENAESLSFDNAQFDYVLCKEAFHHFPRPFIALYEMLRVSMQGVVLIEPNDSFYPHSIVRHLFTSIVRLTISLLSKNCNSHRFEESGNFIYNISKRELEKVALGMNLRMIAFKGFNDFYLYGAEFEKLSKKGQIYKKIRFRIMLLDVLSRLNLIEHGMLAAIMFKREPSENLISKLKQDGFDIIYLPVNPYII